MRFVPVKTAEQQAALMLAGLREQLMRRRTQLSNAIRGHAGRVRAGRRQGAATRSSRCWRASRRMPTLPALARELFGVPWRAICRGSSRELRADRSQADGLAQAAMN